MCGSGERWIAGPSIMVSRVEKMERLAAELGSLKTGRQAAEGLAGYGQEAVPALRRFLLEGAPQKVFLPRLWAVEALARIGAEDVLVEYLSVAREIPDPEDRFGEEAVESAAARCLCARPDERIFRFLVELSGRRMLQGLIDSLASFGRPEALPYFERALEDDFYRSSAEEAFRKFGESSVEFLARSAVTPKPGFAMETRSSLERRRCALKLLHEIGTPPDCWRVLRELIDDPDEQVFVALSKIGAASAPEEDREILAGRSLALLSSAPWYLQEDIENVLVALQNYVAADIDAEIMRRLEQPPEVRAADARLRALISVRKRFAGA